MARSTSRAVSAIVGQVVGAVVEQVAEAAPTGTAPADARSRAARRTSPPGPCSFRISTTSGVELAGARAVVLRLPGRARGCPCRACGRCRRRSSGPSAPLAISACSHVGALKYLCHGSFGQRVGHRLDDVRHGVQADHVGGAVGRRLRAADQRAGQRVDLVEAQAEAAAVWCIVASIENTPMRLPMKFGVSLA